MLAKVKIYFLYNLDVLLCIFFSLHVPLTWPPLIEEIKKRLFSCIETPSGYKQHDQIFSILSCSGLTAKRLFEYKDILAWSIIVQLPELDALCSNFCLNLISIQSTATLTSNTIVKLIHPYYSFCFVLATGTRRISELLFKTKLELRY